MAVVHFTSEQVLFLFLFGRLWFEDFTLNVEVFLFSDGHRVRRLAQSFVRKFTRHQLTFRDINIFSFGGADGFLW